MILIVSGCSKKDTDPTSAPKQLLSESLGLLNAHDYDGYLKLVDISTEMDSVQYELLKQVLNQHQTRQEAHLGEVTEVKVVNAKLANDSVCTVFFQQVFSNGSKDVSSQKLVRINGEWKVRLRN